MAHGHLLAHGDIVAHGDVVAHKYVVAYRKCGDTYIGDVLAQGNVVVSPEAAVPGSSRVAFTMILRHCRIIV